MRIRVKLFASFREGRFQEEIRDYHPGAKVSEVAAELGLAEEPSVIFVNNRHAELKQVLEEGDTLALFPPVGGG